MTWTLSTIVAEIFYCVIGLLFDASMKRKYAARK